MVGENVLRHHDLYNQIVAEGHQVGNHTFQSYRCLQAPRHLPTCSTHIRRTISSMPISSVHLTAGCDQVSIGEAHTTPKVIMWDVVTRDYSKWMTAEDVMVNNVSRYARNGSIITFTTR